MKPPLIKGNSDDFQTPPIALNPLLPYLKKDWVLWECACGKGNLVKALEGKGYNVLATDINGGGNSKLDFIIDTMSFPYDCIITNPPYSLKQQFLQRCYELQKPFALLLPLTTFETRKRQALFKKYGLEVIFFPKRINFETPSGKGSGSWFATAWFTWGLNIGKELNWFQEDSMAIQEILL